MQYFVEEHFTPPLSTRFFIVLLRAIIPREKWRIQWRAGSTFWAEVEGGGRGVGDEYPISRIPVAESNDFSARYLVYSDPNISDPINPPSINILHLVYFFAKQYPVSREPPIGPQKP